MKLQVLASAALVLLSAIPSALSEVSSLKMKICMHTYLLQFPLYLFVGFIIAHKTLPLLSSTKLLFYDIPFRKQAMP